MKSTNPIYKVTDAETAVVRLIEAPTRARAVAFAAKRFTAVPASAKDVATLMLAGAKVEYAEEKAHG